MAKGVEVTLYDATGAAYASGTNIAVLWFDNDVVPEISSALGRSATATTTSGGVLSLDLDGVTGLDVGEWGFLLCYKLDEADHKDSLVFASRMQVASMTGTTVLGPLIDWVRNPEWLTLPSVEGLQKVAALVAVFPSGNYLTVSAVGAYTVNWGDGSGDMNYSSGVVAERSIAYGDASATSDPGIANAVAVTFTDSGDVVNRTAHGFNNRDVIAFSTITTTTGISTHTRYRVFNATADTFQVSVIGNATDAAVALTNDGSGAVYEPMYRQVVMTLVPNGGNLTAISFANPHSAVANSRFDSGLLDVAISGEHLTSVLFSALQPGAPANGNFQQKHLLLEQFSLYAPLLKRAGTLLAACASLQNIVKLVLSNQLITAAATADATTEVVTSVGHGLSEGDPVYLDPVYLAVRYAKNVTADTFQLSDYAGTVSNLPTSGACTFYSGVDTINLFAWCISLQGVPMMDFSAAITTESIFRNSTALRSIPKLDFSESISIATAFEYARSLSSIPALDFSNVGSAYLCFRDSAISSPVEMDFPKATDLSYVFDTARGLLGAKINAPVATTINSIFNNCNSLRTLDLTISSACTNISAAFSRTANLHKLKIKGTLGATNVSGFASDSGYGGAMTLFPELDFTNATTIGDFIQQYDNLRKARLHNPGVSFSLTSRQLSAEELNEVYRGLRSGVTAQTVTVTGNPGTTGDDPTIATAKGWTVTG